MIRAVAFICATLGTLALGAPASAATRNWDGLPGCPAGNAPWSTAACWQGATVPGTGDDVVVCPGTCSIGGVPGDYDLGAGVQLHSITFNTDDSAYAITGGPIPLQSGGFITDNASDINADSLPSISLNGPATFTLGSVTNSLAFNGAITGIGPLTVVNNAGLDDLRLNAVNTYSGATTVNGTARVVAAVNGSIPINSALTVNGGIDFQNESTIGSLAGGGIVSVNAPSLTAGGDNTDTTFSGIIQGGPGAAFTKAGTGTLTLSGANSYSGQTTISGGTLSVTGSLSSFVSVGSGGTLAGTGSVGTFGTIIDPGGRVAPGTNSSVGALGSGSVLLDTGTEYAVDFDGGGNDRLDVSGEVTLGADLDVSLLSGYSHAPGTVHTIIANNGSVEVHGTFAGLAEGDTFTVGGNVFRVSYVGGSGNDVTLRSLAAPTLSANASPGVSVGGQIHDTATLAGGFATSGTITYRLYGPDDANCSGSPAFTDSKTILGNGSSDSASFTPTQSGTYRWVASYGGDQNNAAVAGACNDPNQSVTVTAESPPDPVDPTPEIMVTGLERDREAGTATLTVTANQAGSLSVDKTKKVKPFGPVTLTEAGSAELEIVAPGGAAKRLKRNGKLKVNPRVVFTTDAAEIKIRHQFKLRRN